MSLTLEARDPFLDTMFARMSPGAEALFSSSQIDEIRRAFGARTAGAHMIEWRFSLRLGRKSYYTVFLVGRERRSKPRFALSIPGLTFKTAMLGVLAFLIIGICF